MLNVSAKGWLGGGSSHAYFWDPSASDETNLKIMLASYVTPTPTDEWDGHTITVDVEVTEWDGLQPDGSFKLGWSLHYQGNILNPGWDGNDFLVLQPGEWFVHPVVSEAFKPYSREELLSKYTIQEV